MEPTGPQYMGPYQIQAADLTRSVQARRQADRERAMGRETATREGPRGTRGSSRTEDR